MRGKLTLSILIVLAFVVLGCSSSDDSNVSSGSDSGTETSFNFTMTSYLSQETASLTPGTQADFTADQIMTGSLTATPSGGGTALVFDWSIYFDETTFDVQSNKTIILAPGTYDFSLLITKGSQEYAGTATGVSISDGTFDVPMTISPVIGDTVTDVTLVASLADFKFQYDPAELSAASLSNPQMGIIVDGGTEEVFTINPTTGISDNYVNLPEGSHTVQLKLYEASLQVGRSITAQESVIITAGLDLAMDLVALHGETTFALTEASGDANFQFNIPAEVVNEAGGLSNLEALFSLVGPNNVLQEQVLALTEDGSGDYEAEVTLTGMQFDEVTFSLVFNDLTTSPKEQLGACSEEVTLDAIQRTVNCDIDLRIRAIATGTLLATLGINVLNEAGEPVEGAVVYNEETPLGITGSGTFGSSGYLKIYLNAGEYTLRAEDATMFDEEIITLTSLGLANLEMVLDTEIPPEILLPDTGQTTCFNQSGNTIACPVSGQPLAQDGSYIGNAMSFTDMGNGIIADNNTNLFWQQTDDNVARNWASAVSYCQSLSLSGNSDWRLPTNKELLSIVNYNNSYPSIDVSYFPDTNSDRYWTSTEYASDSSMAWNILFSYGVILNSTKSNNYYVRCVRGGSGSVLWPLDFSVQADGTVVHQSTGLVWQQEDDDTEKIWENAIEYCEALSLSGSTDWRLPNIKELQSIVDYSLYDPAFNMSIFPNSANKVFWSSTTIATRSSYSFYLNDTGASGIYSLKSYDQYVRCVRGGM